MWILIMALHVNIWRDILHIGQGKYIWGDLQVAIFCNANLLSRTRGEEDWAKPQAQFNDLVWAFDIAGPLIRPAIAITVFVDSKILFLPSVVPVQAVQPLIKSDLSRLFILPSHASKIKLISLSRYHTRVQTKNMFFLVIHIMFELVSTILVQY